MNRSLLVGTRAGILAQRLRDATGLLRLAWRTPEQLGAYANDMIARLLLERLVTPGGTFLDVGAHIGSVIDGVRRHGKPGKIIAIEAIPAKAEALRGKFPDVSVHACAVGDVDGDLPFFIDRKQSGYSSLFRNEASGAKMEEVVVPIRRLDDLLASEAIDLIKIDVEGAELGVLRGAHALIARSRPTIMFESGPEEKGGYTKAEMWEWLDGAGYAVLVPDRVAHIDDGLTGEGFIEAHLYPRRATNYFAVARERRAEVRARARSVLRLSQGLG